MMEFIAIMSGVATMILGLIAIVVKLNKIQEENIEQTLAIGTLGQDIAKVDLDLTVHKKNDMKYQMESYKDKIVEFYSRLKERPTKKYSEQMYKKTYEHYDSYKKLGGNHYVEEVMKFITKSYEKHYGVGIINAEVDKHSSVV